MSPSSSSQLVACSGTQTELNMAQLERFMELSNLNEQAVSALINHQQVLTQLRGTLTFALTSV